MLETQVVRKSKTNMMVKVGLLSALATLVMYFEFPLPLLPTFLQMDLSEIPVLIGTFALGPVAGVTIELIKNLVHVLSTKTGGIGELANFLIGCAFILPAGLVYYNKKTQKHAILGLIAATIIMPLVAVLLNYFVLIPLYMGKSVSMEQLKTMIIVGIVPFNIVKGIIISVITLLVYKKISPILQK